MPSQVTDEQVAQLAATARPFSLALLRWSSQRFKPDANQIEKAHQRRMMGLKQDGTIAVLCPVASDGYCVLVIMTVPPDEATALMAKDPCVLAGMMSAEVMLCHGFPGDHLPMSIS